MKREVIIIGAGGHSKVIADIILKSNDNVIGFLDDGKEIGTQILLNYKVIGKIDYINEINDNEISYIIAIGNNEIRKQIYERYPNLSYYTAIHPNAVIANDVKIGKGTAIMANSVINTSAKIGEFCIINTGTILEHDNEIGNFVHISPGATLSGTVKVSELVHIGTGSKIKNNININRKCTIGVGTVIVKDINAEGVYVGIPARKIK